MRADFADVNDELWDAQEPLLPAYRPSARGGRPRVANRKCLRRHRLSPSHRMSVEGHQASLDPDRRATLVSRSGRKEACLRKSGTSCSNAMTILKGLIGSGVHGAARVSRPQKGDDSGVFIVLGQRTAANLESSGT